MLAVVLAILVKRVAILKLGLRSIKKDNKSHILKHLHSAAICFDSYSCLSFKIIDKANSKFELKIKEALHINWRKPNLNAQQNHLSLTLLLSSHTPCLSSFFVWVSLSSIIFIIFDTNYRRFYCLNYASLLLCLISTHLVSHLSFSSIIFNISKLIISIFYCLNYISLLLHLIITQLANMFFNNYVINLCPRQIL